MKKLIFLFSLAIAILLPSTLKAQTSDENWFKLRDIIGSNYQKETYGFRNNNLGIPNKLTYFNKIAYINPVKKPKKKSEIKIYEVNRFELSGQVDWNKEQIIITSDFSIDDKGTSVKLKNLPKNSQGWSIYDLNKFAVISSVSSKNLADLANSDILDNVYVYVDPENNPGIEIRVYQKKLAEEEARKRAEEAAKKEEERIKKEEALKLQQQEFEKPLTEKPLDAGEKLLSVDTLKNGIKIGNYKSGKRVVIKPNGENKSFNHKIIILSDDTIVEDNMKKHSNSWDIVTIWFENGDIYEGAVGFKVSEFIESYEKYGKKFIDDILNRSEWNEAEWDNSKPGEFIYGNYTYKNGNVVEIDGGRNKGLIEKKKAAKAKKEQDYWNKLYSKYGKTNVENVKNGIIKVGFSIALIKELRYPSVYHETSSFTWYSVAGEYIKVNNSTGKVVEISKTAPTITK